MTADYQKVAVHILASQVPYMYMCMGVNVCMDGYVRVNTYAYARLAGAVHSWLRAA